MYLSHVSTLEEAAAYLSGKTGDSWTPKSVLDFALTKSKQPSRKPSPIAFAAMPISTTFGRYEFTSPGGMVRKGSARWQLVPLYPIHAAQLVAAGNTFAGILESPDDDYADGVHYAFIEPLETEHEITLGMVRLKRAAIESIARQYGSIQGGHESHLAPSEAESKDVGETLADNSRVFAKRAMVAELKGIWPSITGDLSEASREKGELKAANVRRGYWNVDMCIKWAVAHRKITNNQQLKNYVIEKDDSPFAALLKTLFKI
ncbi:MAG: hypothetical protein IV101_13605 [Dechloromonas sp.]|uniref:hypothetical protein n=1 Tax=Dechloromonas sp. TaxID=1917218 RepID=UPI0027FF256A|nr:hypothetical protein [Dechloromonas sp.]MBT9521915.1 hypothetical protein [Dechloromonas sp.]